MTRRFESPLLGEQSVAQTEIKKKELPEMLSSEQTISDFLDAAARAEDEINGIAKVLGVLRESGLDNSATRAVYQKEYQQLVELGDRLSLLHDDMQRLATDETRSKDERQFAGDSLRLAREALEKVAVKLRYAEEEFRLPLAEPKGLAAAHAMHRKVKAAYAAASHRLSDDQRREFRSHIAQLASTVRQAEESEYRRVFPVVVSLEQALKKHRPVASVALARAERSADALTDALATAVKAR